MSAFIVFLAAAATAYPLLPPTNGQHNLQYPMNPSAPSPQENQNFFAAQNAPTQPQRAPEFVPAAPAAPAVPTAHYGYMLAPFPMSQQAPVQQPVVQAPPTTSAPPTADPATLPPVQSAPQIEFQPAPMFPQSTLTADDQDYLMLSKSLVPNAASSYQNGIGSLQMDQMLPCAASDGRSVTIDHLKISPESLMQIAKLAQAFGSNPDWRMMKLAEMKNVLAQTAPQPLPVRQTYFKSVGL